jgi:hypothetical protein
MKSLQFTNTIGDIFPLRVMGKGIPGTDSFRWLVVHPDMTVLGVYRYTKNAFACARMIKRLGEL